MPDKNPYIQSSIIEWFIIAIAVIFAAFGGVVKYLSDVQEGKEIFAWVKLFIQAVISAFSGSIATLYMIDHQFSLYMTVLGAGLAGFGGVVLLRVILKRAFRHLNLAAPTEEKKGGSDA